jgi:RimJ/RimL family protein N-acetyltransferase
MFTRVQRWVCHAFWASKNGSADRVLRFLVPASARGKGSGRHLALAFLHFAPQLGYQSSIFNLVFATNIASIRIWEKLGFERVGIVKGAGMLKGYTELVDAYMYGYQFPQGSNTVSAQIEK